jgi:hypothetical protein
MWRPAAHHFSRRYRQTCVDRRARSNLRTPSFSRAQLLPDGYSLPPDARTAEPNLSLAMRQINGLYTQHFNRRHRLAGHLFQGRYKAILVQKESYLLELTRYIVLNPVRARMAGAPDEWPSSSHSHFVAQQAPPSWSNLKTDFDCRACVWIADLPLSHLLHLTFDEEPKTLYLHA